MEKERLEQGPACAEACTAHALATKVSLPNAGAALRVKARLAMNRVMKTYLDNLEQLGDEHDEAMGRLMDALPPEHRAQVHVANIYGEARYDAIRSYVLKAGNDGLRELEELIDALRLT